MGNCLVEGVEQLAICKFITINIQSDSTCVAPFKFGNPVYRIATDRNRRSQPSPVCKKLFIKQHLFLYNCSCRNQATILLLNFNQPAATFLHR